jgi:hypothetical protein
VAVKLTVLLPLARQPGDNYVVKEYRPRQELVSVPCMEERQGGRPPTGSLPRSRGDGQLLRGAPGNSKGLVGIQPSFPTRSDRTHDHADPELREPQIPKARGWNEGPGATESQKLA